MFGPLLLFFLLAPYILLLSFGLGWSIVSGFWISLTGGAHFGDAYQALMADPVFWRTLLRTLGVSGLISLTCLLIAYPTAEFISRSSPTWQPILLAFVVVPLWSSAIARTYGWVGIFIRGGAIDRVAGLFGEGPRQLLYTQLAVYVGMVHVMLPFCLLPVYVAVSRYDRRLSLASLSLGAGQLRTLLMIKLPVLGPSLIASMVAVFILSLGFYTTPAILGQPSSQFISNLIAQQVFERFDLPRGEAMGAILIAAVVVALSAVGIGGRVLGRVRR
jgi:ABC-type spermidine/putrescine transport system permease subunit I